MIKTLTIACLSGAMMMTAAVAGPTSSGKSAKSVALPPPPAPACASGISYSNVGLDWGHTWLDGNNDDVNGVNFDASYAIIDKLYVHGTASWADTGSDEWGFTAGLGYGLPLVKNLDLVVEAGGFWGSDSSDKGWYVFPHLRGKWGCLEVHAGAKLICPDGDSNFWEAHVNAYYEIAPNVDLHVGGIFADDADTLQVGVRFKF